MPKGVFSCGEDTVDKWLSEHAYKRHCGYKSRTILAKVDGIENPVGFYSLSTQSHSQRHLTKQIIENIYFTLSGNSFPALHIEWIGVSEKYQDNKVGRYIMGEIFEQFYHAIDKFGLQCMTLQAIDERTEKTYYSMGFRRYEPIRRLMLIGAKQILDGRSKIEENA